MKPGGFRPKPATTAVLAALGAACAGAWAQTPELTRVEITGQRVISTASRLDEDLLRVPFSATVIDRAQMDAAGAKTLEDALRTVPGLQHGTQGNYFTRFETRGLRDTQDVLVLIDGVPLRLLQGNADVTLLAPDLVERVEFIKGPASAVYGKNAIGGVVQFFLKPDAAGGRASLTAGSFGRKDGSVRQRWDLGTDAHLFAGAAYSHVDGFQRGTPRQQSAAVGTSSRPAALAAVKRKESLQSYTSELDRSSDSNKGMFGEQCLFHLIPSRPVSLHGPSKGMS